LQKNTAMCTHKGMLKVLYSQCEKSAGLSLGKPRGSTSPNSRYIKANVSVRIAFSLALSILSNTLKAWFLL